MSGLTSLNAADGSINVSVVSGSSYTGLYSTGGGYNVVQATGGSYVGMYHPCGALNVTNQTSAVYPVRNTDGSLNVSVSPYETGTQHVTVISGSFSGIIGVPATIVIFQGH